MNLNGEGAMVKTKASGMHNVEAGGILTVKGVAGEDQLTQSRRIASPG